MIQSQYFVQKVCAISAIRIHKTGKLHEYISGLFDDESTVGAWFRNNAKFCYTRRDFWLRHSEKVRDGLLLMCSAKLNIKYLVWALQIYSVIRINM